MLDRALEAEFESYRKTLSAVARGPASGPDQLIAKCFAQWPANGRKRQVPCINAPGER
jgi:hypothetical protein